MFDTYYTYKFIKLLTQPYKKMDVFKEGIIDDKGNVVKKVSSAQFDRFTRLVLNLRGLLESFPFGKSTLAKYAVALSLLKEEVESQSVNSDFIMEEFAKIVEESIINTTAGVEIADKSISLNSRTKTDFSTYKNFANKIVFPVDEETYHRARFGKHKQGRYKKFFDEETGQKIKEYVERYPSKGILLQNSKTGNMLSYRPEK